MGKGGRERGGMMKTEEYKDNNGSLVVTNSNNNIGGCGAVVVALNNGMRNTMTMATTAGNDIRQCPFVCPPRRNRPFSL